MTPLPPPPPALARAARDAAPSGRALPPRPPAGHVGAVWRWHRERHRESAERGEGAAPAPGERGEGAAGRRSQPCFLCTSGARLPSPPRGFRRVWGFLCPVRPFAFLRVREAKSRGVAAQPQPAAQGHTGGMGHRVGRAEVAIKVLETLLRA